MAMEARNDLMQDNMRMFTSPANMKDNDQHFETVLKEEFQIIRSRL